MKKFNPHPDQITGFCVILFILGALLLSTCESNAQEVKTLLEDRFEAQKTTRMLFVELTDTVRTRYEWKGRYSTSVAFNGDHITVEVEDSVGVDSVTITRLFYRPRPGEKKYLEIELTELK